MTAKKKKTPPSEITLFEKAEMAVLGAILQFEDALGVCLGLNLRPSHFSKNWNELVFAAVIDVANERGEAVDPITVGAELTRRGQLEEAGAASYLYELVEKVHTAANIRHHVKLILEAAARRALAELGLQIKVAALNGHGFAEVLDQAEKSLPVLRALASPATRTVEVLPMLEAPDFLARQWTAGKTIIAGGNLPERGKLILSAPGGTGKSLLTVSMGIELASGLPILGRFHVSGPQRVGLFILEDQCDETKHRLRAQLDGLELPMTPTGLFVFTREEPFVIAGPGGAPNDAVLDRLRETVRRYALTVVIFDPLIVLHGSQADENSNREMPRWLYPLSAALEAEGCAVILTHHTTWDKDGELHLRGATAIQNWADTVWQLRAAAQGPHPLVKLTCEKINFGPRWSALTLELTPDSMLFRVVNEQGVLCPVPSLVAYLRDEHGGAFTGRRGDFYVAAARYFGCSDRTVRDAVRAALSEQPPRLKDLGRGAALEVIE